METSNKLTGEQLSLWTSSVVDIPANHSVKQESDKEQTTQDTCGRGCEQPLASYNPNTQSWRTSEDISLLGDYKLLENLPKSGMTQNGVLYQQQDWVRPINANESLSWPTPTAVNRAMEGNVRMYRAKVQAGEMTEAEAEAILGKSVWEAHSKIPAMWPTPTYGKLAGGTGGMQQIEAKYLAGVITSEERRAMRAGNGGKLNPMWVEWLMGFPIGWTDLED
jgi:hypothetical protein